MIILGVIAALGIGIVFAFVSWLMGMYSTTVTMERQLNSQYLSNQNYLSTYISGFYEQSGVLVAQSDQLDRILTDAVKGRYDGGFSADGALFSAVVEAYPEASTTALLQNWSKIQDYIVSQREGYKNIQDKLLDMLRNYDTYRTAEPLRAIALSIMGFPSKNLEARLGTTMTTGEVARNQMYLIVLTKDAIKAYESGVMDPLKVPTPTK
jgi:hypothetical protein